MGAEEINRDSVVPVYRQLAAILTARIEAGSLTGLLSERHLAGEYGVAVDTMRAAFKVLREAGLIVTGQGKGSEVVPPEGRGAG